MFLKLNRYSKKSGEYYPWIVNTNSIETVNSTTDGTVIIVSSSTEPQKVLESVKEISARMNGEACYKFPQWDNSLPPAEGRYLCKIWVTPMARPTRPTRKRVIPRPDPSKESYWDYDVRNYFSDSGWDLRDGEDVRGWMDLPDC